MNVVLAAKKYLLPTLESKALAGLHNSIDALVGGYKKGRDATGVLEVMELLADHKDLDSTFGEKIERIRNCYLAELFKLERFRAFLGTDDGQQSMRQITQAVTLGNEALNEAGWKDLKVRRIECCECDSCDTIWSHGSDLLADECRECPGSGSAIWKYWRDVWYKPDEVRNANGSTESSSTHQGIIILQLERRQHHR
jgi:hypothetical protein